jgi:hypothetical protein
MKVLRQIILSRNKDGKCEGRMAGIEKLNEKLRERKTNEKRL